MSAITARETKSGLYAQFARIGKAFDSPQRLELLDLLCQGERAVEDLASEARLSIANTSRHLQVLRAAQLVQSRKAGVKVFYRLSDESVGSFFRSMRSFAEARLADINQILQDYFDAPSLLKPIDRSDLIMKAQAGEVIILDVRPNEEYRQGHLPAALSVPLRELELHLASLPRDREIVAYCRGPYCVLAQEAVKRLKVKGFQAVRLPDGIHEWKEAGMSIESKSIIIEESIV
jgi:rhodanese-related sulfurtransferase/DNA-binding MarR family transcriptional regulator